MTNLAGKEFRDLVNKLIIQKLNKLKLYSILQR